jgi:hypothetical protein
MPAASVPAATSTTASPGIDRAAPIAVITVGTPAEKQSPAAPDDSPFVTVRS